MPRLKKRSLLDRLTDEQKRAVRRVLEESRDRPIMGAYCPVDTCVDMTLPNDCVDEQISTLAELGIYPFRYERGPDDTYLAYCVPPGGHI